MTPWTKERRMQEVVRWMFNENPDIWYVPEAITKANAAGQTINMTFAEAAEIFREMETRRFIAPHKSQIFDVNGDVVKEINGWILDRAATSDIHEFLSMGSANLVFSSLKRFLWDEDKWLAFLVVFVGAFAGGFAVKAGEDFYELIKSSVGAIGRYILK